MTKKKTNNDHDMISYNPTLNMLLVSTKELIPQHLGVGVDGGIDAHALDPADHLGHLALVDGSETGELGVVDHARGRGEVLDEGEVLYTSVEGQLRYKTGSSPCTCPEG